MKIQSKLLLKEEGSRCKFLDVFQTTRAELKKDSLTLSIKLRSEVRYGITIISLVYALSTLA